MRRSAFAAAAFAFALAGCGDGDYAGVDLGGADGGADLKGTPLVVELDGGALETPPPSGGRRGAIHAPTRPGAVPKSTSP